MTKLQPGPGAPLRTATRTGEVQAHKSEWLTPPRVGLVKTYLLAFYYAIYYAILFFTTLFTTVREAPANDLYVFWHVPNRQYGRACDFKVPKGPLQLRCRSPLRLLLLALCKSGADGPSFLSLPPSLESHTLKGHPFFFSGQWDKPEFVAGFCHVTKYRSFSPVSVTSENGHFLTKPGTGNRL